MPELCVYLNGVRTRVVERVRDAEQFIVAEFNATRATRARIRFGSRNIAGYRACGMTMACPNTTLYHMLY